MFRNRLDDSITNPMTTALVLSPNRNRYLFISFLQLSRIPPYAHCSSAKIVKVQSGVQAFLKAD